MPNHRWLLLEKIQQELTTPADLPRGLMSAMVERLDEALLSPSRAQLDALAEQFTGLFEQLVKITPPDIALAALQSNQPDSPERIGYTLGQVGFAQLLAAQAAARRVDDSFAPLLNDSRYKPYVDLLAENELTGKELAAKIDEVEETVSRKLRFLREQGITEFRREGTRLFNFLTPAAQSIINERNAAQSANNRNRPVIKVNLMPLTEKTPPQLRTGFNFTSTHESALAVRK
jgi:DNA-binding transcriptional ArsR family regulator